MVLEVWLDAVIGGVIGLLFGSFLNVVIYRLPKMMERQWAAELAQAEASNQGKQPPEDTQPTFNLMTPRSRCPACGHVVRWHENIPVLSYLFLRGRCSSCKARRASFGVSRAERSAFCTLRKPTVHAEMRLMEASK